MDGMWGMETVGIDTVGIETLGRLDGNQPDTFPLTFENIPPAAFVGLQVTGRWAGEKLFDLIQPQSFEMF
jgi:hypothetical protein